MNEQSELTELLAGRVLGDLSTAEEERLDTALGEPALRDQHYWELEELENTAAAIQLAAATANQVNEQMPVALQEIVRQGASLYLDSPTPTTDRNPDQAVVLPSSQFRDQQSSKSSTVRVREMVAWGLTAACLC